MDHSVVPSSLNKSRNFSSEPALVQTTSLGIQSGREQQSQLLQEGFQKKTSNYWVDGKVMQWTSTLTKWQKLTKQPNFST
jgi:hypothetical protein